MIFPTLFAIAAICELAGFHAIIFLPVAVAGLEGIGYANRYLARGNIYAIAKERADEIQRPLIVVGSPNAATGGYPCGDLCVDLAGCSRCGEPPIDARKIPAKDDSAVVFISCTLEYIPEIREAWKEILRVAGSVDNIFVVAVQNWTLTASAYPNSQWIIEAAPPFSYDLKFRSAMDVSRRNVLER